MSGTGAPVSPGGYGSGDLRKSRLLLYCGFCAAYYFLNCLLRWSGYLIFSGHGVYGWPELTGPQQVGIFLGTLAGPLLAFTGAGLLLQVIARRWALLALVILAIVIFGFVEMDATWYSISQEHIRLVDIELLVGLDPKAHFGVGPDEMTRVWIACLRHVVILITAAVGLVVVISSRTRWINLRRMWAAVAVAIGLTILAGNVAAYLLSAEQSWREINRSNRLGFTVSGLLQRRDPVGRVLQDLYGQIRPAAAPEGRPEHQPADSGRSILVIALEGWNASLVNDTTMPFVSGLRKASHVFEEHYSGGNNTLLGALSLLYGVSPTFYFDHEASGQHSLFLDALRTEGYRTKYIGDGLTSYRFIDGYLTNFTDGGAPLPVGEKALEEVAAFTQRGPRTFTFYYYIDTHFPYRHSSAFSRFQPEVPENYQFKPSEIRSDRIRIVNRYRNTLAEADHFLERLFARIPWRNMIVVLTGDHGEAMLEDGRLSHSSSLGHVQTKTPMSIYVPKDGPSVHQGTTSHIDLFPTLFDLLGIPVPAGTQGRSMLRASRGAALVLHNNQNRRPIEAAVVSGDAKVLVDLEDLRLPRFVGLLDSRDRPATVAGREADIQFAMVRLHEILGIDGCERRTLSAESGATANFRHCPLSASSSAGRPGPRAPAEAREPQQASVPESPQSW